MQLYLDTAAVTEWETWLPTGIFYGITTNPALLERAQVNCSVKHLQALAQKGFELGAQEIHVQTWGEQSYQMVQNGLALADIDERIVVKVPITQTGVTAAAQLISRGATVMMTALYAPHQALIASALGAEYAAPYLGRMCDMGRDGHADIIEMQRALDGVGTLMDLLVASIRNVDDLMVLATQGLGTFTISSAIATALFDVPATTDATAAFEQAAQRMGATSVKLA